MGALIMSVATLVMLIIYRIFSDAKPDHRDRVGLRSPAPSKSNRTQQTPRPSFDDKQTPRKAQREENLNPRSTPGDNAFALLLGTCANFFIVGFIALISAPFLTGADLLIPIFIALVVVGPGGYFTSLSAATRSHFGHRASAATTPFEEAWPGIQEASPYCLLLRPFGADGRLLVVRSPRTFWETVFGRIPTARPFVFYRLTIEQVLQRAFQERFGEDVLALVDQSKSHAPPGPKFVQTSNESWELSIRRLMMRASHIAIVVPPGFGVTSGLAKELDMIKMLRMAHRTIIVGAPRVGDFDIDDESDNAIEQIAEELWGESRHMAQNLLYVTSDHKSTYFSNFEGPTSTRAALFDNFYFDSLRDSAHMLEAP